MKPLPSLEDVILITCARLKLDDLSRDRVISVCQGGRIDWKLVYNAAVAHKIAPLVYKNLRDCGLVNGCLPREIVDKFQNDLRFHALKNAVAREAIAEMAAFFDSRSHEVLLLKHIAFSVRSRNLFDVTTSDDIDVVIRPKGESADLLDERYTFKIRPWMLTDKFQRTFRWLTYDDLDHTSAVIREFLALDHTWNRFFGIEMDNRVHHDLVGYGKIDFRRVWEDAVEFQVGDVSVHAPHIHELIIISSLSVIRKPSLRLRNLVEIHELVQQINKSMDWQAFARKVQVYRCGSLVYSALHATKIVLGSNIPESTLKGLGSDTIRGRAIAFINQGVSPSAICRTTSSDGSPRVPPRTILDLAKRFLVLDMRLLMRFIWRRVFLRRIFKILK